MEGRFPTAEEFEELAAKYMRRAGFADARKTDRGADGGFDVISSAALAQVKAHMKPVGRPAVQNLVGAAHGDSRKLLFFALQGYTSAALQYARNSDVALFTIQLDGTARPANDDAMRLAAAADAGRPADRPTPAPRPIGGLPDSSANTPGAQRAASDLSAAIDRSFAAVSDWLSMLNRCPSEGTLSRLRRAEVELLEVCSTLSDIVQALRLTSVSEVPQLPNVPHPSRADFASSAGTEDDWADAFVSSTRRANLAIASTKDILARPELLLATGGPLRTQIVNTSARIVTSTQAQSRSVTKAARKWNRENEHSKLPY
jgi:Restriction endonuclease.